MKILTVSKQLLNPITLPGMGRSIEVNHLTPEEALGVRYAYQQKELAIEFEEEIGSTYPVINLWPDPHDSTRMTLFIR